jgi:hypothetical protein
MHAPGLAGKKGEEEELAQNCGGGDSVEVSIPAVSAVKVSEGAARVGKAVAGESKVAKEGGVKRRRLLKVDTSSDSENEQESGGDMLLTPTQKGASLLSLMSKLDSLPEYMDEKASDSGDEEMEGSLDGMYVRELREVSLSSDLVIPPSPLQVSSGDMLSNKVVMASQAQKGKRFLTVLSQLRSVQGGDEMEDEVRSVGSTLSDIMDEGEGQVEYAKASMVVGSKGEVVSEGVVGGEVEGISGGSELLIASSLLESSAGGLPALPSEISEEDLLSFI